MSEYYVEITINPVQEFISKVRKTRDLWSGSFMLSLLTASMLMEFKNRYKDAQSMLVSPSVELDSDPMIMLLEKKSWGGKSANEREKNDSNEMFGSLPHFFKVKIDGDKDTAIEIAKFIEDSFKASWEKIADGIWKMLPEEVMGEKQKEIWERQVNGYWTLNWTVSDNLGTDKYGKLNRLALPPSEDWIGCTMFGELADLSGEFRNDKRKGFWRNFRQAYIKNKKVSQSDFDEEEWLSAMGIIKRLFPRYLANVYNLGFKDKLLNYPSTTYFAVRPWLDSIKGRELEQEEKDLLKRYATTVINSVWFPYEMNQPKEGEEFFGLASDAYFVESMDNLEFKDEKAKSELVLMLKKIHKKFKHPGTFYAILLMDGDSLGKLFSSAEKPKELSGKLAEFASQVPRTVMRYDGKLIYAGGDDVLAILSITKVLECAKEIQENYQEKMGKDATISAGIVMAHHKLPLRIALQEAHHQLDDVAKDGNGRSSFAISVLFPSTTKHQWVSTWEDENGKDVLVRLRNLDAGLTDKNFSNSFFYKTLGILEKLGYEGKEDILPELLTAEYYATRDEKRSGKLKERDMILELCRELIDLCKVRKRNPGTIVEYNFGFIRFLKFYRENVIGYEKEEGRD